MDIWSACRFDDVTALRSLLKDGSGEVPCDIRNQFGATPLHFCATYGSSQCAQVLLDNGADFRVQENTSGWTPLHLALYHHRRSLDTALKLIAAGAPCYGPCDKEGLNPLELLSLQLSEQRPQPPQSRPHHLQQRGGSGNGGGGGGLSPWERISNKDALLTPTRDADEAVSYTHLTLPTIYSV